MLEQQQASKEAQQTYAPTVSPNHTAASALTPHANALVSAYVTQVDVEQQAVTRARLEELIAAHLELDAEPEQAARSAIQQLESERLAEAHQHTMAKQQAFQQRKRTRRAKQSARPATLTALKLFGPGALGMIATLITLPDTFDDGFLPGWMIGILLFALFALPALLGAGVGLRARHRRMLGTFLAMGMLMPLMSLASAFAFSLRHPDLRWTDNLIDIACILMLFWLPIGTVAAGLTGWARDAFAKAVEAQSQKSPE